MSSNFFLSKMFVNRIDELGLEKRKAGEDKEKKNQPVCVPNKGWVIWLT